jgi:hypothetical protein
MKANLKKLNRNAQAATSNSEGLAAEGLALARQGRDFLTATEGPQMRLYGLLVVHDSAKKHAPPGAPLIPAAPGWSTAIFLTDASIRAKAKGRVPAIIMVGADRQVVFLESGEN